MKPIATPAVYGTILGSIVMIKDAGYTIHRRIATRNQIVNGTITAGATAWAAGITQLKGIVSNTQIAVGTRHGIIVMSLAAGITTTRRNATPQKTANGMDHVMSLAAGIIKTM